MATRVASFLCFTTVVFAQQHSGGAGPLVPGQSAAPAAQVERSSIASLSDLTRELIENNPGIKAARYRFEAATKRPSQVATLPEPKLNYTNFGVGHPFSGLNVSDFAYHGLGVSQEVPFPGKLSLAGEEAKKEAESERQMYRATVLDTISKLKVAYYEWFVQAKALDITRRNRELMERFERIARARYSVGKGIQQDVLKAQVELSGLAQQLEIFDQRRASAEAQINSLLNRAPNTPLGDPPDLKQSSFDIELSALLALIQENSPQLRSRQSLVDTRAVGINRARKEYLPDFNFGFTWQRTGSQFPDYYMATAEVKIPLYFWRKQRYGVEEAVSRLHEAREDYRETRQELVFTANDQYLVAKTSARVLALYEAGVIPQSSLSLESAMAGYEVGNVDFLTLINNLQTLLNFQMQYYEELAKHEQALARLEPLVGRQLTQP
ncbi:MAG TPA: TolC family protein [Terriglobales bacterium]|nr:TolC family protein [Terriglobales bacterium]